MFLVSIIVPAYNECGNLRVLYSNVEDVFNELQKYDFEIIFVNDGSTDGTQFELEKLVHEFSNIKYIEFSRNFGHQAALKAGLDNSSGDLILSMDADLQHPPELIPKMIEKWEEGYEVVFTIRQYAHDISIFKKATSNIFYKFLNRISDVEIQTGGSDFRLIDKSVLTVVRQLNEDNPFLRGLFKWVGFRQTGIPFVAKGRHSGSSKYTLKKMIRLAVSGITSFSEKPLFVAIYLGFAFTLFAVVTYLINVGHAFYTDTAISGWASLLLTVVFFGGLQLVIIGVLGIYIGKIFAQVKTRPLYIIKNRNF